MENENKLIAEFMGYAFVDGVYESSKDEFHIDEMLYDTSWDWLMPVVQKISDKTFHQRDKFNYSFSIEKTNVTISEKGYKLGKQISIKVEYPFNNEERLKATHKAVVEFIKTHKNK